MDNNIVMAGAEAMSPLALFLQADIIVKLVMFGLLAASVWTWAIIISSGRTIKQVRRDCTTFERNFWETEDLDRLEKQARTSQLPMARIFTAGMAEWRQSTGSKTGDRDGARARLSTAMNVAANREIDQLSDRLNILATIGSVAPFVGLFGTVWGIMRSFTAIAGAQNTSLAVVAPGIAEALFATAIGLFAAIPAVIGYNRLLHSVGRIEGQLLGFADEFHTALSRELENEDR